MQFRLTSIHDIYVFNFNERYLYKILEKLLILKNWKLLIKVDYIWMYFKWEYFWCLTSIFVNLVIYEIILHILSYLLLYLWYII